MFSENIINGTQELTMVPKIMLKGGALKRTPLMDLRNLSDFSEF